MLLIVWSTAGGAHMLCQGCLSSESNIELHNFIVIMHIYNAYKLNNCTSTCIEMYSEESG